VARRLGADCVLGGEVFEDGRIEVRLSGAREGTWTGTYDPRVGGAREAHAKALRAGLEGPVAQAAAALE
jgi:hypothetical protein